MPISEQISTMDAMAGHPAQNSGEPRKMRVVEVDGQGKILTDTTTVGPTIKSNDPCILKVTCRGASMEIPTEAPEATACEIIDYWRR